MLFEFQSVVVLPQSLSLAKSAQAQHSHIKNQGCSNCEVRADISITYSICLWTIHMTHKKVQRNKNLGDQLTNSA